MATDLEGLCSGNRVGRDQQDTGAPLGAASIEKRRRDARRLRSHYELEHPGDPDPLQMLSADNVAKACAWDYPAARVVSSDADKCKDGTALGSIDSIAKSAMFLIRQHFFRETGAGVPLPQEAQLQLQQLERLSREHADKRNADKPAPPPLDRFQLWGSLLHDDILAWIQDHDSFHDTLALDCMGVLTIFGLPSRSGAMRDFRWGQEVTMLEDGDVQFEIGSPAAGAAKNDTYAKFLLSDLTAIGQTRLLRPDLVASALKTLYEASDKTGYVFSRTANGKSRFGDARLRDAFREQELSIGELRRRIETDANSLGREGKLSAPDRERITYILQHTVVAADKDYVHDAEDAARPLVRQDAVSDEELTSQHALAEDAATQDQPADSEALEDAAAAESDSDGQSEPSAMEEWMYQLVARIRALEEAAAGAAAAPTPESSPMLKAIVDKWTVAWETARGCDDDGASLSFHRFLNGDTTDFSTHNCITVTPYEWFSAADGRDWCVLFAQDACNTDQQRTWALTEEEQAFVLSNFPLFAAHFKAISDSEEDTGTHAEPSAMDWSNATDQTLCQFAARIRALEEAAAGAAAAPVPVADGTMMMSLLRAAAACDEQDAKRRRTQ